jgi:AcrR family transcriptional regulator
LAEAVAATAANGVTHRSGLALKSKTFAGPLYALPLTRQLPEISRANIHSLYAALHKQGEFLRQANAQLHSDRRTEILDAARRCFSRTGFHQTSMQQVCAEAGMSPGNVYRYFPSKEAIIAGIAERDRAEVAAQLADAQFTTDFFSTFAALARHHFVERTAEEVGLCAEIMSESRRNPTISKIMNEFDADVKDRLVTMLQSAQARGDISRDADIGTAVEMLMVIADGVWWRRAVDPNFDAEAVLPMFFDVTKYMLLERGKGQQTERSAEPVWARAAGSGGKQ